MIDQSEINRSPKSNMRRWRIKAGATNLDGIFLEEVPMPQPGPGEVRIKLLAVSINARDQIILTG